MARVTNLGVSLLAISCGAASRPPSPPPGNTAGDPPAGACVTPATHDADPDRAGVGDRFPELDGARTVDGAPLRLADLRGKAVVVVVGATWCRPCLDVLAVVDELAAGKDPARVAFVSLLLVDEGRDELASQRFPHLVLGGLPQDAPLAEALLVDDLLPSTHVIDPCGTVTYQIGEAYGAPYDLPIPPELSRAGE